MLPHTPKSLELLEAAYVSPKKAAGFDPKMHEQGPREAVAWKPWSPWSVGESLA